MGCRWVGVEAGMSRDVNFIGWTKCCSMVRGINAIYSLLSLSLCRIHLIIMFLPWLFCKPSSSLTTYPEKISPTHATHLIHLSPHSSVVFDFILIPFSGTHLGLTLLNRTTIENASWRSWRLARDGWPLRRSKRRARDSVEVHPEDEAASREPMTWTAKGETLTAGGQNVFDLGWRKNWRQVMGERWWLWYGMLSSSSFVVYLVSKSSHARLTYAPPHSFVLRINPVPFGKIPGNGLTFPVNPAVYTEYRNEIIEAKERRQDALRVEQAERWWVAVDNMSERMGLCSARAPWEGSAGGGFKCIYSEHSTFNHSVVMLDICIKNSIWIPTRVVAQWLFMCWRLIG